MNAHPQFIILSLLLAVSLCTEPCFARDIYEEDNSYSRAAVIVINDTTSQSHDLHLSGDQDWIQFYGLDSTNYQIEVSNAGTGIDPYIELYGQDGVTELAESNNSGLGGEETLLWHCFEEGIYFVKIGHVSGSVYGEQIGYHLELITPDLLSFPGFLSGTIQSESGVSIAGATIKAQHSSTGTRGSGISLINGSFLVSLEQGSCVLTAQATGYNSKTVSASVPGSVAIRLSTSDPDPGNSPPTAVSDMVTVYRGGTVTGNVLQNDHDSDGDELTAELGRNVENGSLIFNNDGSFAYRHDNSTTIFDSFTYYAGDGTARSSEATVTIKVVSDNTMPWLSLLLLK